MEDLVIGNPNKRVNVISVEIQDTDGKILQQSGMLMRTTRSYAARLISNGTHTITSKGKLKSYLNKSRKLYKNSQFIKQFDLNDKKAGHKMFEDTFSGKTYILIKRKEKEFTITNKKEINPLTGLPMSHTIMLPMYQSIIAKFPN